ncbi:type II toxin-antitoxin system RelE/ParE family toxin [Lonepinella sp. BR2474]|uniref:type II toxin-antitoxin system RelE/ParE family toxin n=1 Tax=Lonepinella sp. BR2474 TaxID=3434548 RepID=UPI003F6E1551
MSYTENTDEEKPKKEWTVLLTDCFWDWVQQQNRETQRSVTRALTILKMAGPYLSRPYADTVNGSKYANMKELRIQHNGRPLRAFFAFDPLRQAIVLCAGDKSNDKLFYKHMIRLADQEFTTYLKTLE